MKPDKLSLEDTLRALANAGELSYLSLIPTAGPGRGGVVFSASFSPASKWGQGMARDPDPVNAILSAIHDTRMKDLVKTLKIDTAELPMVSQTAPTPAEQARIAGAAPPAVEATDIPEDFLSTE